MRVELNVRGLSCPLPVLKTKQAVDKGATSLVVQGDSAVSRENIQKFLRNAGFEVTVTNNNEGEWEMRAEKAAAGK